MISPEQCRAARALLNWTQADLASRVSISAVSIRAFEKGGEMRDSNQKLLRLTFEQAGIQFIPENGGGAGVRMARPKASLDGKRPEDLNATNDD
ncbi:XRE family transcriptional regulator [Mesorhizobium sp. DCY119]|nr:XRE family transcriptional regulator [Mesorhizobium sp. DCY119]